MQKHAQPQQAFVTITAGDPAPWFFQRSTDEEIALDRLGGRYIVLCFFGSAGDPAGQRAIQTVLDRRALFDDKRASFFGVSFDPADEAEGRIRDSLPGVRFFCDFDGAVSRRYGAIPKDAKVTQNVERRRFSIVLDPMLRVMKVFPFSDDGNETAELLAFLEGLPPLSEFAGFEIPAPILILPNVFEPNLCQLLVSLYDKHGGRESGVLQEVDGKTVNKLDRSFKSRRDYQLKDPNLINQLRVRINRRVVPQIQKVYHFRCTRAERYIVCCYAAEEGGHFLPHRDNTNTASAHRRFALSINLNADFEGGALSFPEYGPRSYKAPSGCAVVFSTPLLHAVSPVTSGRRYAFLPFLYDDEAAKIRETNSKAGGEAGAYNEYSL